MSANYKEYRGKYTEYQCTNCGFWLLVTEKIGFERIKFDCP